MFPIPLFSRNNVAVMGTTYISKVLGYSPIAYWPLNEAAGASVAVCNVDAAQNGTPTDTTFANILGPDGVNNAPRFDASRSYIDISTAALNTSFNGREGAVSMWINLPAATWSVTGYRYAFEIYRGADNSIQLYKAYAADQFGFVYEANNVGVAYTKTGITSDDTWVHVGMRWSDTGNLVEYFWNGVEIGSSQDAMNESFGTDAISNAKISQNSAAESIDGWIAHVALFNTPVSDAVMLGLGTVLA
jgi:hypothetical protein